MNCWKRPLLFLVIAAAGIVGFAAAGGEPICDVTWADPVDGAWSDPTKWTGGEVPAADEHACISDPGTYTVKVTTASPVAALDITNPDATLWVKGGEISHVTFAVAGAVENAGTLRLESVNSGYESLFSAASLHIAPGGVLDVNNGSGGPRNVNAVLHNEGTVDVSGTWLYLDTTGSAAHRSSGSIVIDAGAVLEANDSDDTFRITGGTLANAGTFTVYGGGLILDGGTLTGNDARLGYGALTFGTGSTTTGKIQVSGSVALTGDIPASAAVWVKGGLFSHASLTSASPFTNAGTLRLESVSSGYESLLTVASGGTLTNTGTLEINPGTGGPRSLTGTLDNRGSLRVATGFSLESNGVHETSGLFEIVPGGRVDLTGGDTLKVTGGDLHTRGLLRFSGATLDLAGGRLNLDAGGDVLADAVPLQVAASTLRLDPSASVAGNLIEMSASSVLDGDIPAGLELWVKGGQDSHALLTSAAGFTNAGKLRLQSVSSGYESGLSVAGGPLVNTGTLDVVVGSGGPRWLAGTLDNRGSLAVTGTTFALDGNGVTHDNTGSVTVSAGATLEQRDPADTFRQSGSATFANDGAFVVASGTLRLDGGTLTGNAPSIVGATLRFGPGLESPPVGTVIVSSFSNLEGDIPAGVTVWVKGGQDSHARLLAATGFTNAGTLRLESISGGYESYVQITDGALVNTGTLLAGRGAYGYRGVVGDFDNRGTLTIDNIPFHLDKNGGSYSNRGAIDITGPDGRLEMNHAADTFRQISGTITNSGSTGFFSGRVQLEGGTFSPVVGGESPNQFTGTPLHVIAGTVAFPPGSTFTGTVVTSSGSSLDGDIPAGVTVWVKGGQDNNARLDSATGFTNAGTLRLESINGGYESYVSVADGALVNTGAIVVNGGAGGYRGILGDFDNRAALTIDGTTLWLDSNGGTHRNTGSITISAGARLELNDANDTFRQISGTITNGGSTGFYYGRVQLEGGTFAGSGTPLHVIGGTLAFPAGSTFGGTVVTSASSALDGDVPAGVTVRIRGGQDNNAWLTAAQSFTNHGTLYLETISGGYHTELATAAGQTFTNQGTIYVTPGAGGPRVITGALVNRGTLNVTDITLGVDGNGATHETSGAVNILGSGRLQVDDWRDTFRVTGGTITNQGSTGFFDGRLQLEGGSFVSAGSGTPLHLIRGTLAFTPGSTFSGRIVTSASAALDGDIPAGVTVHIRGGQDSNAWLTSAHSFTNFGTVHLETISGGYHTELAVNAGGTFTNAGSLSSDPGAGGPRWISADTVVNDGSITIVPGSHLYFARSGGGLANEGQITIPDGHTLSTAGGFAFENVAPGSVTGGGNLNVNGDFGGTGTVAADVSVENGTISVGEEPNTLTVDGNLFQAPSATVELQLGLSDNDPTSDLLAVNGQANFAGPLAITRADGFLPMPCDLYAVVTYGTLGTGFSSVAGDDLGDGLRLRRVFRDGTLFLAAFDENQPINVLPAYVSVAEGGHGAYQACLAAAPTAAVTVTATAGAGVTVQPAAVTFTTSDWQLPKSFTVTALDNEVDGDDVTMTSVANVATSADPAVDGFTREVEIEIADDDHTPVAAAVPATTDEDTVKAVTLSATDADTGDVLTYAVVSGPSHGSLGTVSGAGVTYTPSANWHGTDTFTYTASDGTNMSAPATVTLTVNPVNDAPVATAGVLVTAEDTGAQFTLSGTDVDGDALTYTVAGQPGHGSISGTGATRTYAPALNYHGSDTFTFTANDGQVDSTGTATITVTITPVNDAPVAQAVSATTAEDTPGAVTLAGTDVDGDPIAYSVATGPGHGSVTGGLGAGRTYTPAADYHGADSFTFRVSDGLLQSDPATASVTVTPVNDAPVALAGSATTAEDTQGTVTLTGSDVDGDALGYAVVDGPDHGTLGAVVNGTVSYTPAADYHGPDSFTFKANDGTVDSAAPATITLTVTPVNDAPVATAGSATTAEDTPGPVTLPATDVDGDPLTWTVVGPPSHGTISSGTSGTRTYTPAANYSGSDSFTFKANDGTADSATVTVTITVTPVNDAPVAGDDEYAVPAGTAIDLDVTTNDTDIDSATLTVIATGAAGHGTAEVNGSKVAYTPVSGYAGHDTFTYTVSDGAGGTGTATVTVHVGSAPAASAGSATTAEETPVAVTMSGLDPDGAPLTYVIVGTPAHGTLGAVTGNSVTYTPALNYTGSDSFTFKVTNGGYDSNVATISLTVTPVNDVPSATGTTATLAEDGSVQLTLAGTDVDGDALTATVVSGPAHGSLTGTGASRTYSPEANYHGSDSVTFTVNDGTADSAEATVAITVTPVNDAPIAGDVTVGDVVEDTAKPVALAASDPADGQTAFTYKVVSLPAHGSLRLPGGSTNLQVGAGAGASGVVYVPAADYDGADSFTYRANDGAADSAAAATVTLTVDPVDDLPVADAKSVSVIEGQPATVTLTGADIDHSPGALTFALQDGAGPDPAKGNASAPGTTSVVGGKAQATLTYTAAFGPGAGTDGFDYTVCSGPGACATGHVTVTIVRANRAPVATTTPVLTATAGGMVEFDATPYAGDADGPAGVSWSVAAQPQQGTVTGKAGAPGVFEYRAPSSPGSWSFTLGASDGAATTPVVVSVVVNPAIPPVVRCTSVTLSPDKVSPEQPTGTAVTFTAASPGCDARFRYSWQKSTDTTPHVMTLTSAGLNQLRLQPGQDGTFWVSVEAGRMQADGTFASDVRSEYRAVIFRSPAPVNCTAASTWLSSSNGAGGLSSSQVIGSTLTFAAYASGPTSEACRNIQFKFDLMTSGSTTPVRSQGWSGTSQFAVNTSGLAQGYYAVSVSARDGSRTSGADVTAMTSNLWFQRPAPKLCASSSLSFSSSSYASGRPDPHQPIGAQLTWISPSSGCNARVQWWLRTPAGRWFTIKPYQVDAFHTFDTSKPLFATNEWGQSEQINWTAGTYYVATWTDDATNVGVEDHHLSAGGVPFTLFQQSNNACTAPTTLVPTNPVTGAVMPVNVPKGTKILFKASTSTCPYAHFQYLHLPLNPNGSWNSLTGYGPSATYLWDTGRSDVPIGNNWVAIWAKDSTAPGGQVSAGGVYVNVTRAGASYAAAGDEIPEVAPPASLEETPLAPVSAQGIVILPPLPDDAGPLPLLDTILKPGLTGYRMVARDGGVYAFGDAKFLGSTGNLKLNSPVVGMAETPSKQGYWLVAEDGGVFSFGDAAFFGSTGAMKLNSPIVGIAATPSGKGYWLVASDGGIFSFGDAAFFGSAGAVRLNQPIVGLSPSPSGKGYWLVASDGGIFSFGDAGFLGSTGAISLNKPIVGLAATPSGKGYWLVASDGGVFSFGDAAFAGSAGAIRLNQPIVGLLADPAGSGYLMVAADGGVFSFGTARFLGSVGSVTLNSPVVGVR